MDEEIAFDGFMSTGLAQFDSDLESKKEGFIDDVLLYNY
jgi:hypothetical protein